MRSLVLALAIISYPKVDESSLNGDSGSPSLPCLEVERQYQKALKDLKECKKDECCEEQYLVDYLEELKSDCHNEEN